jgi:hypothetical protein
MESKRRIELLLSLTKLSSKPTIDALHNYLVDGWTESRAIVINGIEQSNFSRALAKLNKVASVVEEIKNIDWAKFQQSVK